MVRGEPGCAVLLLTLVPLRSPRSLSVPKRGAKPVARGAVVAGVVGEVVDGGIDEAVEALTEAACHQAQRGEIS